MTQQNSPKKVALVMAGGTGGHIFPGLAVAQGLREQGWEVHWLGVPAGMEEGLVKPKGFAFEGVVFGGLRGKGLAAKLLLPWRLMKACLAALSVIRRVKPDVLIGFGGYITFPGGLMGFLSGRPLVLHEQNSVAGLANKVLAKLAKRVFLAFPNALPGGEFIGNPLRAEFMQQEEPKARYASRSGVLKLLVVGGSLGAQALNSMVPKALALINADKRPQTLHQSGAQQIEALRKNYEVAGVEAELTPFIENTAQAYANADVVIARAGASTVTELAAVGVPALFVPFPQAVDDHQTANAMFLVSAGAAWLVQQKDLEIEKLAQWLQGLSREELLDKATKAYAQKQLNAVQVMVEACEGLVKA
ncbi:MAG: undecaprenyldiphospho-muramoylpentapeptide beta-N-acetylglucosaminyltransferase [Saezia sp.]